MHFSDLRKVDNKDGVFSVHGAHRYYIKNYNLESIELFHCLNYKSICKLDRIMLMYLKAHELEVDGCLRLPFPPLFGESKVIIKGDCDLYIAFQK